jgi:hypothetical protein
MRYKSARMLYSLAWQRNSSKYPDPGNSVRNNFALVERMRLTWKINDLDPVLQDHGLHGHCNVIDKWSEWAVKESISSVLIPFVVGGSECMCPLIPRGTASDGGLRKHDTFFKLSELALS